MDQKLFFLFFGPPGSGKGTQAKMLSKKISLPVVSTGNLLRKEQKLHTDLGEKIKDTLNKGVLVSDDLVEEIIEKIIQRGGLNNGGILDGFPRNENQQQFLLKEMKAKIKQNYNIHAILIDVSDEEVVERLGGRRVCICGETYHVKYNPPKKENICNVLEREIYTRKDDKLNVIKDRLDIYHKDMKPIYRYWQTKKKLMKVDGEQDIDSVQSDILSGLKELNLLK